MNRFPLSCGFAALLAGSLAAQVPIINIVIPNNAWVVAPAFGMGWNTFDYWVANTHVQGMAITRIGTSATVNEYTIASSSFTGDIQGNPGLSGVLPTQTNAGTETYTYVAGGGPNPVPISSVTCNLNAYVDTALSDVTQSGAGYRGVANASVTVGCPSYSLAASCQARGVLPPLPPLVMTTPQNGNVTLTGLTSWWIAMSSTADVTGTMTGPNAHLHLSAYCAANGTVTLD